MSHRFKFTVEVTLDRTEGKFATRDEMSAAITEALEGAELGDFQGDEGGQYEVSAWEVSEQ